MKKLILLIVIVFLGIIVFQKNKPAKPNNLTPFSVALDWTPNTNHTGIYVAIQKGWYKDAGLDVKILPYSQNSTADLLVSTGKADAGISSTESVISDSATGNPVVSIGAIVQHNLYGLIALKESSINSPKDLDGKIYGGFGAPYENAVISKVIQKDGGKGEFKNITLSVGAMQALQSKKVDFVWVSEGWEAIEAKRSGQKINFFPMKDYGIADYYTPVIITSPKEIKEKKNLLKKFMTATSKGYEYARNNSKESAQILIKEAPKGTFPDIGLVLESQKFLSPRYADKGRAWGLQDKNAWHDYPQFMLDSGAVTDSAGKKVIKLNLDDLYTNEFLQK